MIKPRFVFFTVWYCEEVCTKYPGTKPSNIKMQEVPFSNSQTETCRNLYNICEGSVREGGEGDRNTPGEVSNKQMPSSVWGRLFSPVWSWSCPLQHYNWSVSDQCDTVTAHTCNYQSSQTSPNLSSASILQCVETMFIMTVTPPITTLLDVIVTFSKALLWLKCENNVLRLSS